MKFQPEPRHEHGAPSRTAIVLVNLGTPEAPTAKAVRSYLKQFLSDPRVVEIPRLVWWFILNLIILPLRSGKSAQKYASIWTPKGSPLKHHTQMQAALLAQQLAQRGHEVDVAYAMRYGNPSVASVLEQVKSRNCDRVLIVPAYPQYAGATTASVWDAVFAHYSRVRNVPELRLVRNYHDQQAYIEALQNAVTRHWDANGQGEKLVMSFHGVPKRTLMLGDPYHCECYKTARLLAQALGLTADQYLVTFQSRFGKAEWLQPYTAPTLKQLAKQGVKSVDVICPGFTADCLETLEEIAMEVRSDFLTAGGATFQYIPCLNESPVWIEGLAAICEQHMLGWPTRVHGPERELDAADNARSRERALALGAGQ
ncbi:ferrochelatase [Lacisediminimonas sp.]|uniref:ferrochelatase n=1 Tax=Lacisediminimonas sp. TaxID=3060582 RepID=UPI00271A4FE7|nr:ferrochelatase [Lacisediminimonas sp.]MDO8300332.1 ferrochelatase [Lacisediminimonas sp.]MDO9217588.1 ferrochelatase [Lacisediminimonas sp.]